MTSKTIFHITLAGIISISLYLCATIQLQYYVNGNITWLLIAAERFLEGQNIVEHIYESNPPLSIFIYIPHVLFSKLSGVSLPDSSIIVTFILPILSTLHVHHIIKQFPNLKTHEAIAFTTAYFMSITIATTSSFSEREHFIIMTIAPFILCQYAMIEKIHINKVLLWFTYLIGALFILVKPHYGILPTIFLIHRAIKFRTLKIVFDPDFLSLSIMTILYLSVLFIFFFDYLSIVFPDAVSLYAKTVYNVEHTKAVTQTYMLVFISVFLFELFREDPDNKNKSLIMLLHLSCIICMIPYYTQMKGFYNHLVPALSFFLMGTMLTIYYSVKKKIKKYEISMSIALIATLLMISYFYSVKTDSLKQKDIANLSPTVFLEENCPKPCTFFAFHSDIELFNPIAATMGYTHASRFPAMWFLPELLKKPEENTELKQKYTRFLIKDLKHYQPNIILVLKDLTIHFIPFDFYEYFGEDPELEKILSTQYEKQEDFNFHESEYYTRQENGWTYKYDVYFRKPNP